MALSDLIKAGLAHFVSERIEGSARPVERWFATLVN
jgi:hypothetical protein